MMGIELIDHSKTFELTYPGGAVFTCRHWTNAMDDEVRRACLVVGDPASGKFSYNSVLEREMMIDMSVVSWTGVFLDGAEAPCDSQHKKMLPTGTAIWLQRELEELAGLRMTQEEKKN